MAGVLPSREVTISSISHLGFGMYTSEEVRERKVDACLASASSTCCILLATLHTCNTQWRCTSGTRTALSPSLQIRQLSIKEIKNPTTMNAAGEHLPDGLYDPALGLLHTATFKERCITCDMEQSRCAGHFGHIELPVPVLNPLLIKCAPVLVSCP